jgi:hypothetical protein
MSKFQQRVQRWMFRVFDEEIVLSAEERNERFLEEAVELVQALNMTEEQAIQVVKYVFGRPKGEVRQEVGGVMVTLATLCSVQGINPFTCADVEMTRVEDPAIMAKVKAKQALKPKFRADRPDLSFEMTREEFIHRFPWVDPTVGKEGADPMRRNSDLDLKPCVVEKQGHVAVCTGSVHKGLGYIRPSPSAHLDRVANLDWELFSVSSIGVIDGQTYLWGMYVEGIGAFNVMVPKEFTRELLPHEREAWSKQRMGMYGSHSDKFSYTTGSGVAPVEEA